MVTLSLSPASLAEGNGATDVTVTATLSAARTSSTTVTLSLAGTAQASDYSVPASLPSITIPASSTTGSAGLAVAPVDDAYFERSETIEVQGSAGDLDVTAASLALDDETAPTLELLGAPHASIREGEGSV